MHPVCRAPGRPFPGPQPLSSLFVRDVAVWDGTQMAPGSEYVKVWRLRNNGTRAWPVTTSLLHVGGDALSASKSMPVGVVAPGAEVDVAVHCTAPRPSGRYCGFWRLSASGKDTAFRRGGRFGQRIWSQINVLPEEELRKEATVAAAVEADTVAVDQEAAVAAENESSAPAAAVAEAKEALDSAFRGAPELMKGMGEFLGALSAAAKGEMGDASGDIGNAFSGLFGALSEAMREMGDRAAVEETGAESGETAQGPEAEAEDAAVGDGRGSQALGTVEGQDDEESLEEWSHVGPEPECDSTVGPEPECDSECD